MVILLKFTRTQIYLTKTNQGSFYQLSSLTFLPFYCRFHHFAPPGWLSPKKGNRQRFSSRTRTGHEYSTSTVSWNEGSQTEAKKILRKWKIQSGRRVVTKYMNSLLVFFPIQNNMCQFFHCWLIINPCFHLTWLYKHIESRLPTTWEDGKLLPRCVGWTKAKPSAFGSGKMTHTRFFGGQMAQINHISNVRNSYNMSVILWCSCMFTHGWF